jgi:hypothetical protein
LNGLEEVEMAKSNSAKGKRKNAGGAAKRARRPRFRGGDKPASQMTVDDILQWFEDNANVTIAGPVGKPKMHFAQKVYDVHEPKLRKQIEKVLKTIPFDEKAKTGTGIVASDIGTICRMLFLDETEVTEDQFDAVRVFVKDNHHACKKTLGGGDWCDY